VRRESYKIGEKTKYAYMSMKTGGANRNEEERAFSSSTEGKQKKRKER
jgi:hypothetical protein